MRVRRVLIGIAGLLAVGAGMAGLAGTASASPAPASVTPAAGVTFSIVEDRTGKCIDIPNSSTTAGVAAQQFGCHGGANQKFFSVSVGSSFLLVNQNSNLCLARQGGLLSRVIQVFCNSGDSAQLWQLTPVVGNPAHLWLQSTGTSLCAQIDPDAAVDGAKIDMGTCANDNRMWWHFV